MAKKKEADPVTVMRFSESHLWVRAEGAGAQVGISDQGQNELGEIIGVELPDIGDPIEKGQTLLIIEAMKVMNQIRAPRSGRLARILVTDTEPVEYGAPLMLIE